MKTLSFIPIGLRLLLLPALVGALLATLCSSALGQGSLTPPGPPGPSMKTLAQVEPRLPISSVPFTITNSGSYYAATNLTPAANQNGIIIAADNVTVDLEGFTLSGGGGGSGEGISLSGARANLVIRNGTVRNWPGSGINLTTAGSSQVLLQSLKVISNVFSGCALLSSARVIDCLALGNGSKGFSVTSGCLVEHCRAAGNGLDGIFAGDNCRIMNNECVSNGKAGGYNGGVHLLGTNNIVQENVCTDNVRGLAVDGPGNVIAANVIKGNTDNYDMVQGNQLDLLLCEIPETIDWPANLKLAGPLTGKPGFSALIIAANDVTVDLNGMSLSGAPGPTVDGIYISGVRTNLSVHHGTIRNWGSGINTYDAGGVATTVREVRAINNSFTGIAVGRYSRVVDCIALSNATRGILAGDNSVVKSCTVTGNGWDGIYCDSRCVVSDNLSNTNGYGNGAGCGINVIGAGNRIEGNQVADNLNRGIQLSSGNVAIRNTAFHNGLNYAPSSISDLGPTNAPPSTATSPWANFSYP